MDSEDDIDIETMFQYISCCSLSTSPIFFTIKLTRFNTSHVVVYLLIVEHITLKKLSFNTSHVVVYLRILFPVHTGQDCFNTSHVVVYHM